MARLSRYDVRWCSMTPPGMSTPLCLDRVEDEPHLPLVVEHLELLVGDRRDLDVEGALREQGVAVPAGPDLLLGLRDLLAGADGVDQPDERDVGARLLQADRRRRRPAPRPVTSRPG